MANIKLDNNYSLHSDARQWILSKDERAIGYFGLFETAITSYLQAKIRSSNARSIVGLLNYHKALLCNVQQVLTPLKIRVDVSKGMQKLEAEK